MPLRLLAVIIVAFGLGSLAAFALRPSGGPTIQSGKALIGGPFALTNQDGKRMTEQDFRGKYMLVAFGYTSCPDVCPAELQTMANAMDTLGSKADKVNPVFITIDPERDTAEQMRSYVKNFSPRFIGLTGTAEEIKQAARAYRVFYAKSEEKNSALGYLMDHSAFIYLMNPQGEYVTHFAYGVPPDKIAATIEKAMADGGSAS
jgi:cytochrome oxidase Cu insertion factor (SCO1/SenC/PrrC family)